MQKYFLSIIMFVLTTLTSTLFGFENELFDFKLNGFEFNGNCINECELGNIIDFELKDLESMFTTQSTPERKYRKSIVFNAEIELLLGSEAIILYGFSAGYRSISLDTGYELFFGFLTSDYSGSVVYLNFNFLSFEGSADSDYAGSSGIYDYYNVTNYGKSWAGFNYLILSYGFSVGLCISPISDDISGFFVGGNLDVNYLIGGFLDTRARLVLRIAVADDEVLFLIGIGCKFGFDIRVSTSPKHDFE